MPGVVHFYKRRYIFKDITNSQDHERTEKISTFSAPRLQQFAKNYVSKTLTMCPASVLLQRGQRNKAMVYYAV